MRRFWRLAPALALAGAVCAVSACGSAGNDVPSGGTGSNANVGGGATVVARPTTAGGATPGTGVTSPGQGSGSTLGASTPNPSPSAAR